MEGDPKFPASQRVPDFGYAAFAESLGLRGLRMDRPEDVGSVWDAALSADRPVVIEAVTDPEVPPLPPHMTREQAVNFAKSIYKRDPRAGRMIRQAFKEILDSVIPTK